LRGGVGDVAARDELLHQGLQLGEDTVDLGAPVLQLGGRRLHLCIGDVHVCHDVPILSVVDSGPPTTRCWSPGITPGFDTTSITTRTGPTRPRRRTVVESPSSRRRAVVG